MIDLEIKSPYGDPCCVSSCDKDDRKYYPNFHYQGETDIDLPKEGTMTVKFKRTSREVTDRDGKERYSYSVDIVAIESVNEDKVDAPAKSYDEASSALDKIAAALNKK